MITLDATDETLEMLTGAAVNTDFYVAWADQTTTVFTPGQTDGQSTTATTTVIAAAPAASTQRQIKFVAIRNRGTASQTVTLKFDKAATERYLTPDVVLQAGECLEYTSGAGFYVVGINGARKIADPIANGVSGRTVAYMQVGTAAEAAGNWYSHAKDTGYPGAWAPGTPGLAGRVTDGTAAGDVGCIPYQDAASGANYLTSFQCAATIVRTQALLDVLWVNSGLVVATLTAQTINSVAFPARDLNGSTNGEGVWVGILVTAATTNAGAIANTTMSYTNQSGTAGRTATIAAFPATAVIGTVVWFQLQAGDTGVRSIQTVTLTTSYVAGSISLIAAVPLAFAGCGLVNISADAPIDRDTGIRLYNGTTMLLMGIASAVTACTITGAVQVTNR